MPAHQTSSGDRRGKLREFRPAYCRLSSEQLEALGTHALAHALQHETALLAQPKGGESIKKREGLLANNTGDVLGLGLDARYALSRFAAFQVVVTRTEQSRDLELLISKMVELLQWREGTIRLDAVELL